MSRCRRGILGMLAVLALSAVAVSAFVPTVPYRCAGVGARRLARPTPPPLALRTVAARTRRTRMSALGRGPGSLGAGEGDDGNERDVCASAGAPACLPSMPCRAPPSIRGVAARD